MEQKKEDELRQHQEEARKRQERIDALIKERDHNLKEIKERDKQFLSALKHVYQSVSNASTSLSPIAARRICTDCIREAFSITNVQIKGSTK